MCNTPESSLTTPNPQSTKKLSSKKLVPGAKKVGDCCFRAIKLAVIAEKTVGWRGDWRAE